MSDHEHTSPSISNKAWPWMCSFLSCGRSILQSVGDFWMLLFQTNLEWLFCLLQPFLQMHTYVFVCVLCVVMFMHVHLVCKYGLSYWKPGWWRFGCVHEVCCCDFVARVCYCGGEEMWLNWAPAASMPEGRDACAPCTPHTDMCNVKFLFLLLEIENC